MAIIQRPQPVKLFVGMLAGKNEWLVLATSRLVERYGPVDLSSPVIPFTWTDYYADEMGPGLLRQFLSFERLVAPDALASIKCRTNTIEGNLAREIADGPARPVNLDPGYLELSKIVLATAKDFAHRVYLGEGIYAQVTLQYHHGRWEAWPWTFPDYRSEPYGEFFLAMRALFSTQKRSD